MGAYKAAVVTEGGQNLIAQALADKKTVMFTSAKTSSYAYPSGTNIAALTGLRDIVQSVIPSRSQVLNDNVAQVTARFDNDGITQQYLIQTIGLYAQIEDDPEILFSVAQAITPDEMPVHSNVSPSAFVYNIHHTVQNAAQIIITVNPAGTATVEDIWSIENPEFDDSGIVEGITSFPDLLDKIRSKMNIFQFYRDLKAGLRFVLHVGQIVDNCTSTDTDKPLAANQGKALWDKIVEVATALTTHKSSGDHDGRYYTEAEINNLLNAKLSIANIVNNLTSTATNMALSAAQGKALNDRINQLNGEKLAAGKIYFKEHNFNARVEGRAEAKGTIAFRSAFGDPSKFRTLYWQLRQNYVGGTYYQAIDMDVHYNISGSTFDYVLYNNNAGAYTVPCKLLILVVEF